MHELVGPLCSDEVFFRLNIATTPGAEQSLCAINEWMPGMGNGLTTEEWVGLLQEEGAAGVVAVDSVSGQRAGVC